MSIQSKMDLQTSKTKRMAESLNNFKDSLTRGELKQMYAGSNISNKVRMVRSTDYDVEEKLSQQNNMFPFRSTRLALRPQSGVPLASCNQFAENNTGKGLHPARKSAKIKKRAGVHLVSTHLPPNQTSFGDN